MNIIVGKFNQTGVNEVDVALVEKKWCDLWLIAQWGESFKLVKYVSKDSETMQLKTEVSPGQAYEIIERLGLTCTKSAFFNRGASWRKKRESMTNDEKTLIDFLNWLSESGWYAAADGEYDNTEEPNSCFRLTAREVVQEYLIKEKGYEVDMDDFAAGSSRPLKLKKKEKA